MLPALIALVAATSWGMSAVLVRQGMRDLSATIGTMISLTSGLIFTTVLVAVLDFDSLSEISLRGIVLFAIIGVLNFPLGRFFNYMAMDRLGVARSTPILACAPLFAVMIAVAFLGEDLQLGTVAGITLMLSGLFLTVTAPR